MAGGHSPLASGCTLEYQKDFCRVVSQDRYSDLGIRLQLADKLLRVGLISDHFYVAMDVDFR